MSTNYQKGRRVEYAVRDQLIKAGYFVVRSSRSKGPADLVALKRAIYLGRSIVVALLVNCKLDITACSREDWNETYFAAMDAGAVPIIAGKLNKRIVLLEMVSPKRIRESVLDVSKGFML